MHQKTKFPNLIYILFFLFIFNQFPIFSQTTEPILRINTDMHSVTIKRIDSDAEGKYILTSSNDKTARLWEASSGRLLQIFRPPIDEGNEGKLYACALSPDGQYAALSGFTGWKWDNKISIYIFNTQTNIMEYRVGGLENVIFDLEYSSDGRYLAASMGVDKGVRIIDTNGYFVSKRLTGYGESSYNVSFSSRNMFAAISYDGFLRLYDRNFSLKHKVELTGGDNPYGLAFSPDGSLLAVGFTDSNRVQIFNIRNLHLEYEADNTDIPENKKMNKLTWSSDGSYLYGGGTYSKIIDGEWWNIIRRWDNKGNGNYIDLKGSRNTILDLKTLANGEILFVGYQPDWGKLSVDGEQLLYYRGDILSLLSTDKTHLRTSANAMDIGFTPYNEEPLQFSLSDLFLTELQSKGESYSDTGAGIEISNWQSSTNPYLNDKPLTFLGTSEKSRSLSVSPSGEHLLFGADFYIYNLDAKGLVQWKKPVSGTAWAVNCSADEKVLIAALADGTIRWYRLTDGKELLALFVHADRKRWVLWSPTGYYACSPGGQELIGWHLNNGPDQAGDFFPASRFEAQFYRPDMLSLLLETLDEDEALAQANRARNIRTVKTDFQDLLPPVINILSPADGHGIDSDRVEIKVSIRTPNENPVKELKAMVNGRPVENTRGLNVVSTGGTTRSIFVTLKPGENYISVMAKNSISWSEPAGVLVNYKKEEIQYVIKPKLYVLAIGVSQYENPDLVLQYGAKDAKDFMNTMKKQEGKLYREVSGKLLIDGNATQDSILDGLNWIHTQTTSNDIAMIFVAGHGINDNSGRLYFLPSEANLDNLRRTAVPFDEISYTVESIPSKVLCFIDTCHSGGIEVASRRGSGDIDMTGLINELSAAESGAVVFASSSGKQFSLEKAEWGNGAFTKALIEGLSGEADFLNKGKITVNMLDLYISERVKELTGGQQTPTTAKPDTVPDYPIAVK
jgi:WD40 repeat protein